MQCRTPNWVLSRGVSLVATLALFGCAGVRDADKCNADLGTTWASRSCLNALQEPGNQAIVAALGNGACARAKLSTSDAAVGNAACEEARAKAEKAAWVAIERAASAGTQPNLVLDDLVPGLPKAPPETTTLGKTGAGGMSGIASAPLVPKPAAPPQTLTPAQAASFPANVATIDAPSSSASPQTVGSGPNGARETSTLVDAYLRAERSPAGFKLADGSMLQWGYDQGQLRALSSNVFCLADDCIAQSPSLPAPYTAATFMFYDRQFYKVFASFDPIKFEEIEESLIQALGKPKQRGVGTVQNAMGATFDQAMSLWDTGTVSIELMKRVHVDTGSFTMTYLPIAKEVPQPAKPVAPF